MPRVIWVMKMKFVWARMTKKRAKDGFLFSQTKKMHSFFFPLSLSLTIRIGSALVILIVEWLKFCLNLNVISLLSQCQKCEKYILLMMKQKRWVEVAVNSSYKWLETISLVHDIMHKAKELFLSLTQAHCQVLCFIKTIQVVTYHRMTHSAFFFLLKSECSRWLYLS